MTEQQIESELSDIADVAKCQRDHLALRNYPVAGDAQVALTLIERLAKVLLENVKVEEKDLRTGD